MRLREGRACTAKLIHNHSNCEPGGCSLTLSPASASWGRQASACLLSMLPYPRLRPPLLASPPCLLCSGHTGFLSVILRPMLAWLFVAALPSDLNPLPSNLHGPGSFSWFRSHLFVRPSKLSFPHQLPCHSKHFYFPESVGHHQKVCWTLYLCTFIDGVAHCKAGPVLLCSPSTKSGIWHIVRARQKLWNKRVNFTSQ